MKIPTEVRLCWDFFLGGALVSARLCRLPEQEVTPIKQELHFQGVHLSQVHQPSKNCSNKHSPIKTMCNHAQSLYRTFFVFKRP